jgi:uncharacterized LabA/DUF88 family protein
MQNFNMNDPDNHSSNSNLDSQYNSTLKLNPAPVYPYNNITNNLNYDKYEKTQPNNCQNCYCIRDRLSIFVDGNNMFYAQQKNSWFFDPRKVLDYFTRDPSVMLINAFWYTGLKDSQDQRGFRDALISLGYTVRTKILKEYYDDISGKFSQKANLDIEIVVDMFNTVDQYDRVVLFSGDGDFERAIELLRSKSTHITVVSTEGMIARELRNATDRYIDLNDIRPSIEKNDY